MRLQEMPSQDRPREKLALRGPEALTDTELLAIFLRTGTKARSVMEVARDLLASCGGSLAALAQTCRTPDELMATVSGIGLAKASELCAAIELANRIRRGNQPREEIGTARQVWEFFGTEMQTHDREVLKILMLDTRLKLIRDLDISTGSLSECVVHPREVFRPAIIAKAYAIIVAHNHPSGDPSPSTNDHTLTRKLAETAKVLQIQLCDHVIIGTADGGRQPYFSFRDTGVLG